MFVLGIDPGLSRCGYGVVERIGRGRSRAVAAGVLRTDPAADVPRRLADLQADLRSLLREHRPAVMAIERVLFQANARTAIPVAQAAGVAMVEAVAAGCEVAEYSPNRVKQTITGDGGAGKDQMERMVQTLLGIARPLRPVDAADAVAVALCHVAHAPLRERVGDLPGGATGAIGFRAADLEASGSRTGTDDLRLRAAEPAPSWVRAEVSP
ncbi:MAG TPA: crossover junction endodeoxyribonuclease RuvC [Acidimicrobiales bacterium]|nr:crossover junction endodeoxyribonuclease RuvC [Acidimicrobiales bacterium]